MNNCEYCGDYNASYEEGHIDSETHQYNCFLSMKNDLKCRDENGISIKEVRILEQHINNMQIKYNLNEKVECGNVDNTDCKFIGTLKEVMVHERQCIGFQRGNEKKYNFIECDKCNKRFYDKGQKMKPIYSLNAHSKLCGGLQKKAIKKKLIQSIKEKNLTIDVLNKIQEILDSN